MSRAQKLIDEMLREADDAMEALEELDLLMKKIQKTAREAVQYTSTTPEEKKMNSYLKDVEKQLANAKFALDKAFQEAENFG